jgi:hypothetical protein
MLVLLCEPLLQTLTSQTVRVLRSVGELLKTKRIGAQYKALGSKLTPLAPASEEFQMIAKCVTSFSSFVPFNLTPPSPHHRYIGTTNYPKVSCQIEEAFLIEPYGFSVSLPHSSLFPHFFILVLFLISRKNDVGKEVEKAALKKLLWHGAILPFVPSILRNGFQLPPSGSSKLPAGRASLSSFFPSSFSLLFLPPYLRPFLFPFNAPKPDTTWFFFCSQFIFLMSFQRVWRSPNPSLLRNVQWLVSS